MATHANTIFVSYARKDGEALGARLHKDLTELGFSVWLDTRSMTPGVTWDKETAAALRRTDVVLVILTPGFEQSVTCGDEIHLALKLGKRIVPLLASATTLVPFRIDRLQRIDFTKQASYETSLRKLLDALTNDGAPAETIDHRRGYASVPPLPANYLERPQELAALRSALLRPAEVHGIALTALVGMGGIGKTILAQALCADPEVHKVFPDGIAWVTIGRQSTQSLSERLRTLGRSLGEDFSEIESESECIESYRSALASKAALVVVDDVWVSGDVEPFRASAPRSRILFTTRDTEIAAALGANSHTADPLNDEQSRGVLSKWSGFAADTLPAEASEMVKECGGLPLALALAGAMVRDKPVALWHRVLDLLRRADLEKIKADFPNYPHHDLFRVIEVSVGALDANTRRCYLSLGVLLEDMSAPPAIQQLLWNQREEEALETAERLFSLSLAQREGDSLRLHDLQLDYVRKSCPWGAALGLIHQAIQLSSHVIDKDPRQFASQLVGRLHEVGHNPGVGSFLKELTAAIPFPWIRPLHGGLTPPGTALLRTLSARFGLSSVTITPDSRLAVASESNEVNVWNLVSGKHVRGLFGHTGQVEGVAVTPDGRLVISASYDRTLKVWDLESGRELKTLHGHVSWVLGVAVTPNGKQVVSASSDHTLKVWDLASGRERRTLAGHTDQVIGVAVTPNGKQVVSASFDNTLRVWNLESGRELHTLSGHTSQVRAVAVTPNGRHAVSGSADGTLRVWDLESGQELRTLSSRVGASCVAVTPNGMRVVSAAFDKTLKVWDLESGKELRTLSGHTDQVEGLAVTPDGRWAVSASNDGTLKVWDIEERQSSWALPFSHTEKVLGVAVRPGGRQAVSASRDRTLKVWDLASGRVLRTLSGHRFSVEAVAVTRDGRHAVSASTDDTLIVWSLDSGLQLRKLSGHKERVKRVLRDMRQIVSGSVNGVAVTPDGRRVLSASSDETLKIWDFATGRELRTFRGHTAGVKAVVVTPDGLQAISASYDDTLRVWDLASGQTLLTLSGHAYQVMAVDVTPDGRYGISASLSAIKVWDLESGQELRTLLGHSGWVYGVAVTPSGVRFVSAGGEGALKVWDLESGKAIATFTCDGAARCCASVSDTEFVVGDTAGRLYVLELMMPG